MPAKPKLVETDSEEPVALEGSLKNPYPTLEVNGRVFVCKTDKLPFGTMLKYAESDLDLLSIRRLMIKVIAEKDLEDVWDAFDNVGVADASDAISAMIGKFSERPTKRSGS